MIEETTVLVLGAGSSMHLDYPSGSGLVSEIIRNLEPKGKKYEAYLDLGLTKNEIEGFRNSLKLSGQTSIDSFLEHRNEYQDIGKFAVAQALIPIEDMSVLFSDKENWFRHLFQSMNCKREEFIQNSISIVTFNYDRSLDTYLYTSVKNTYGISDEEAYDIIKKIPIIHLHGKLGSLPWEKGKPGRQYENTEDLKLIKESSNHIKIIHEDIDKSVEFCKARELFSKAEKIVFLGFGYNETNMERLQIPFDSCTKVIGSSIGMEYMEIKNIDVKYRRLEIGHTADSSLHFLRKWVSLD